MRSARPRVTDVPDNCEAALIPKSVQFFQRGMQAQMVVQLEHVVGLDGQPGSAGVVDVIRKRHNRVQAVVTPSQLNDDEHRLFA